MKKDQVRQIFLILETNNITEKIHSKNVITDQQKTKQNTLIHYHPEDDEEKARKFCEKKCKIMHEVNM